MRQYGCIRGNVFDSERDFRVATARARENRFGDMLAAEQIDACEPDIWHLLDDECKWDDYHGRETYYEKAVHGLVPKRCVP